MTLRVAIAGCGLIAGGPVREGRSLRGNHAEACTQVDGVRLIAAADPSPARRQAFGACWGVDALYDTAGDMLAAEHPDIFIVASPPDTHEQLVVAAVSAGVRGILCEKPLSGTHDGASRIVQLCHSSNVPLVVNFTRRWDLSHAQLAQRLASGDFGRITMVRGTYTGTIRGNGSHLVDTIAMFVGSDRWKPMWVSPWRHGDGDDGPLSASFIRDGVEIHVTNLPGSDYFLFEIEIFASKGRARLMFSGNDLRLDLAGPHPDYPGYAYLHEVEVLPRTLPMAHGRALAELATAVLEGTKPKVPAEDHVQTLERVDELVLRAKGTLS